MEGLDIPFFREYSNFIPEIVCLVVCAIWTIKILLFKRSAKSATGTVIHLTERATSKGMVYIPEIEFLTGSNEKIVFKPPVYTAALLNSELGQKVDVLYREERPEKAKVDRFFALWFWPCIVPFVSIGLIFATHFLM